MNVIFGNYGNNTLALIAWALEKKLKDVKDVVVIDVDTGWAAPEWSTHVARVKTYLAASDVQTITLTAKMGFADMVRDRGDFPSIQFQWCAGFLKGLPFLEWAEKADPLCEATVLLPRRRADGPQFKNLPEFVEGSEHFGDRTLWHPLFNCDDATRDAWVRQSGVEPLAHRSLECDPCVHNTPEDTKRMSAQTCTKLRALEEEVGVTMFTRDQLPTLGRSCRDPYCCGK